MIKYNSKTENTKKAAVFCSGEHLGGHICPMCFMKVLEYPHVEETLRWKQFIALTSSHSSWPQQAAQLDHKGSCWITKEGAPEPGFYSPKFRKKQPNLELIGVIWQCWDVQGHDCILYIVYIYTYTPGKGVRKEQLPLSHFNLVPQLFPDTLGAEIPALSTQQQLGAPTACSGFALGSNHPIVGTELLSER